MTQTSNLEAAPVTVTAPSISANSSTSQPNAGTATCANKHNCDILLNNFQIKKKRYRVLFNYDHLVWERIESKLGHNNTPESNSRKEVEYESERLSQRAAYGNGTQVVYIDEIIRVSKGDTKSAALHLESSEASSETAPFEGNLTSAQSQQQQSTQCPTSKPTEQYLCISYAERVVHSATDCNRWRVRTLTLYNADAYVVRQWHTLLTKALDSSSPERMRVRRLLVFINPYGGRKQGLQIYERYCKPLFLLGGIDASCIISQRSNQIRDILLSHDLSPYDAVCCVGGDGTVGEVINGLVFRAIRDLGMDARQPRFVPKPALPIAIIPAGSTDTVAYSLHGTADVRTAAIHLLLGQRRGVDICSVRNRQGIARFCASLVSYGYLGDVAAKSEKYRWMGTKRYEYTGVQTFLLNRGYEAEIRIRKPPSEGSDEELKSHLERTICKAKCERCSVALATPKAAPPSVDPVIGTADNHELPTHSNLSLYTQKSSEDNNNSSIATAVADELDECAAERSGSNDEWHDFDNITNIKSMDCDRGAEVVTMRNQLQINEQFNPTAASLVSQTNVNSEELANDEDDSDWQVIKGKFFMVTGANITCACSRSPNGVSRYSHLGDGYLDLILVRSTSLLSNVQFVKNTMGRNGDISTLPFVELYRTQEFRFCAPSPPQEEITSMRGSCQPITSNIDTDDDKDDNFSCWNCDGEVLRDLELSISSHCQLIDVFMRGPHVYNKPSKDDNTILNCCKSTN